MKVEARSSTLLLNFSVAAAYIAAGSLCFALAVYSDYIAPLWLPAGIGLGVLLVWGARVSPAIWITPPLTFLLASAVLPRLPQAEEAFLVIGIGLVSTAQIFAGRDFLEKSSALPGRLSAPREILSLFAIGGVASAALGGIIVVIGLALMRGLSAEAALQLWGVWTIGHATGVVIVAPAVILMFSRDESISLKRKGGVIASLAALLGVTALAFNIVADREQDHSALLFTQDARVFQQRFEEALHAHTQNLDSVARLHKSSNFVEQREFSQFLEGSFEEYPAMLSIMWVRAPVEEGRVAASQGPALVEYPVAYVEPDEWREGLTGFDLAARAPFAEVLKEAARTGNTTVTPPLPPEIWAGAGPQLPFTIVMVVPAFNTADGVSQQGFVAGHIDIAALIQMAGGSSAERTVSLRDITDRKSPLVLYETNVDEESDASFSWARGFSFAGRVWELSVSSNTHFPMSYDNRWQSWAMLIGGMGLAGAIAIFILVLTGRNDVVESLVREKTQQIGASEERLRLLIRHTPAAVAMFDKNMRFIMASNRWSEDYLLGGQDLPGKSIYDVFPEIVRIPGWLDAHKRAMEGEQISREEDAVDWPGMDRQWIKWEARPWRDDVGEIGGIVIFVEVITARKIAERRAELLRNLSIEAASAETIEKGLEATVHMLCEFLDCKVGHGFLWNAEAQRLQSANAWHINEKDPAHQLYKQVTQELSLTPGSGLPGRVLSQKAPVYIDRAQVSGKGEFPRQGLINAMGMRWGVAFPIFIAGEVEAVIELYSAKRIGADSAVRGLFEMVSLQLGRILERTRFRRALNQSYKLNELIVTKAPYMLIATDLDGTVLTFNEAAEKALGYRASEVIGKHTPQRWLKDSEIEDKARQLSEKTGRRVSTALELFTAATLSAGNNEGEWTFVHKDGHEFPVWLAVNPLRDEDGELSGFLGIIRDMTEAKAQEHALIESEQTFRLAMENASIGMALVAPEGNWLKVNSALCELIGYSPEELLSIDFQSVTHPEDLEKDLGLVRQVLAGEIPSYTMEKRYIRKGGTHIWVLLNVSLVRDGDGEPNYFVAQIQDITERKHIETLKNEFVSTVSHELRTPLTSIRGALSLVSSGAAGALPEKAERLIQIAHKNGDRLIHIINDILDIEKIESGRLEIELKSVPVNPFLEQALEANAAYGDKFDVEFTFEPAEGAPEVRADPDRLMQIMANLLSNAAKFSPKSAGVEVVAEDLGDTVRISVHDHGIGIPDEFRDKIFEKFAQADNSDTRRHEGTGLGLSITRKLVQMMGGEIDFTSVPYQGTTFFFDLPKVEPASLPAKENGPGTILVCTADQDAGEVLTGCLKRAGYGVDLVLTLRQAELKLAQNTYAAITLDLRLPGGNAASLVRDVKRAQGRNDAPIVVVTMGSDTVNGSVEGAALHIAGWLTKPYREEELIEAIREAVRKAARAPARLLHVEDDDDLTRVVRASLEPDIEVVGARTLEEARVQLAGLPFALVVIDIGLPDGSGLDLLQDITDVQSGRSTPVLILSAHDVGHDIRKKVSAALVKSRASEAQIVEAIQTHIRQTS